MHILTGNKVIHPSVVLCTASALKAYQKNGLEEEFTGLKTFLVAVTCEETHRNMSGSQVDAIQIC